MKKLMLICLALTFVGCGLVEVTPTEDLLLESVGRRLGYMAVTEDVELTAQIKPLLQTIVTGDLEVVGIAKEALMQIVDKYLDDPLLAADLEALLRIVDVKAPVMTEADMLAVKSVARGMLFGIGLGDRVTIMGGH